MAQIWDPISHTPFRAVSDFGTESDTGIICYWYDPGPLIAYDSLISHASGAWTNKAAPTTDVINDMYSGEGYSTWYGRYVGGKPTKLVIWTGFKTRYFYTGSAGAYSLFYNNIETAEIDYNNARQIGGGALVDVGGVDWLVAAAIAKDYSVVKIYKGLPPVATQSDWVLAAEADWPTLPPNKYVQIMQWFFSGDGLKAIGIGRLKDTTNSDITYALFRMTISADLTSANIVELPRGDVEEETAYSYSATLTTANEQDFQFDVSDTVTVTYTNIDDGLIVAADYIDDQEVYAKLKYTGDVLIESGSASWTGHSLDYVPSPVASGGGWSKSQNFTSLFVLDINGQAVEIDKGVSANSYSTSVVDGYGDDYAGTTDTDTFNIELLHLDIRAKFLAAIKHTKVYSGSLSRSAGVDHADISSSDTSAASFYFSARGDESNQEERGETIETTGTGSIPGPPLYRVYLGAHEESYTSSNTVKFSETYQMPTFEDQSNLKDYRCAVDSVFYAAFVNAENHPFDDLPLDNQLRYLEDGAMDAVTGAATTDIFYWLLPYISNS